MSFSEESLRKIAEQKVKLRFTLKVHAATFILVHALLFFVNLLFTPTYLWVMFPLLGWGCGFILHIALYDMYARGVYPMAKRGLICHFLAFLVILFLLIAINMNFMSFEMNPITWAIFPIIFWFAAIIIHTVVYHIYFRAEIQKNGVAKSKKEKAIEKEMEKIKKNVNQ